MINSKNEVNAKHGHCSQMSNSPWTDLNSNNTVLKVT